MEYIKVCANQLHPAFLPEETISSEILNGHATTSATTEEVKVHIESPDIQNQEQEKEQESRTDGTGDKTGDQYTCLSFFPTCMPFFCVLEVPSKSPLFFLSTDDFWSYTTTKVLKAPLAEFPLPLEFLFFILYGGVIQMYIAKCYGNTSPICSSTWRNTM